MGRPGHRGGAFEPRPAWRARRWFRRGAGALLAAVLGAGGLSCAARIAPPTDVAAPRYPDFVFPTSVGEAGDAAARLDLDRAWRLLQAGHLSDAERALMRLRRRFPTFHAADTALGYVAIAGGNTGRALGWFGRVIEQHPRDAAALAGRGEALLAATRPGEALEAFEAALAADASLDLVRRRVESLRFSVLGDLLARARGAASAGDLPAARAAYLQSIAASPESAFLYREVAEVERRLKATNEAVGHLRRATALDPDDGAAWLALGELLDGQGETDAAIEALTRARAVDPHGRAGEALARVRRRAEAAALPPEYSAIAASTALTRAELAALIGVRLGSLVAQAPNRPGVLVTDVGGHWATPWILAVTRAGILDGFPNHTFRPQTPVRRTDLALAVSRLLDLIAARRGPQQSAWRAARPAIADLPAGHLGYPAAAIAVAAGVLALDPGGAFVPSRFVTGEEAHRAVDRLEVLAR